MTDEWWSGEQMADELGRLIAVLRLLHEVLGAASMVADDPALVCSLDERSMAHAQQAELLVDHLPRRDGVDRMALINLGPLDGLDDLLQRHVAQPALLLRAHQALVLPRLARAVDRLSSHTSDAAERSLRRSLRFVAVDLSFEAVTWRETEALPGPGPLSAFDEELAEVLLRGGFD